MYPDQMHSQRSKISFMYKDKLKTDYKILYVVPDKALN